MLFLGGQIITSLLIAYGDFKERKILLLVLIALFLINLSNLFFILEFPILLLTVGINLFVVSVTFSITYLYLKKVKKIRNPAKSHLGIGDWLFFLAISPSFIPEVFVYVFLLMNVVSLIFGILASLITKKQYEIPYAGISALIFALLCIIQYISPLEILALV